MNKITIKKASLKDWNEYKEIRLEALQKDPVAFGRSYQEEKTRSEKDWKDKLKDKNRVTLLALDGNKVIGISAVIFESSPKLSHIADLISVYLKKEYRGKGISNQLMNKLMEIIKLKKRIRKIKLEVTISQSAAIN